MRWFQESMANWGWMDVSETRAVRTQGASGRGGALLGRRGHSKRDGDSQRGAAGGYLGRASLAELAAVVAVGVLHIVIELWFSEATALAFSAAVVLAFSCYLAWRIRTVPGVLRVWGFRTDNLRASLKAHLGFTAVGSVVLVGASAALGRLEAPPTIWLTFLLYPLWGLAQQFALQNLVARNVAQMVRGSFAVAVVAALLFGLSHFPRMDLVALTLGSGVIFTWIYQRYPNLLAVGLSHGILGTLAIYLILGEDPVGVLLGLV